MNLDSDRISLFDIYAVSVAYRFYIYTQYHSMHRALHAHSKKINSPKVLKKDHKNTASENTAAWKVKWAVDINGKIHIMSSTVRIRAYN